jgi:hypothetical protein
MRKALIVPLLCLLAAAAWVALRSCSAARPGGLQGDPEVVAVAIMKTAVRAAGALATEAPGEGRVAEFIREDATRRITRFFEDEGLGRAAASALLGCAPASFSITDVSRGTGDCTVTFEARVRHARAAGQGGAGGEAGTIAIAFHLERRRGRWQVVEVTGGLEPVIEAAR